MFKLFFKNFKKKLHEQWWKNGYRENLKAKPEIKKPISC